MMTRNPRAWAWDFARALFVMVTVFALIAAGTIGGFMLMGPLGGFAGAFLACCIILAAVYASDP